MNWFWAAWGLLIGASFGSFLAATIWRRKEGLSLNGRSICSSCGAPIPSRWNVPLVSWPLLKGRARCCQAKLDFKDFLWEIAGATVGAAVAFFFGPLGLGILFLIVLIIALLTQII